MWRPLAQSLVWPRVLVVLHELTEHVLQVVTTQDQQVFQALAPGCPCPSLGERIRQGRPHRQPDYFHPLAPEHLIEGRENLASRSRSRNRGLSSPSAIRHASCRACWATQAAEGLAGAASQVDATTAQLDVRNSTYRRWSQTVWTVKKSVARIWSRASVGTAARWSGLEAEPAACHDSGGHRGWSRGGRARRA